jgi:hypothetical protein
MHGPSGVSSPSALFDAGDQVLVLVRVVAKGSASGVPIELPDAHVHTLRDGRLTSTCVYAAASGAIAGAAIVIAKGIVNDAASVAIVAVSLVVLLQKRVRVPEPALIGAAAVVGLVAFG